VKGTVMCRSHCVCCVDGTKVRESLHLIVKDRD
jgi:hypothetical protein